MCIGLSFPMCCTQQTGWVQMLPYPHLPGHYKTLHHCIPAAPTIIATINTISKSNGIQNLKITDLHGHLLFDSSMDPALLAGVDEYNEDNDEDTSLAGVHDEDTSITGVPIPNTQAATTATSADNELDTEPNHDSIEPNEADNISSKVSVHSTGSHISIHIDTSEPPHPPLNKELNDVELPEPETQVPKLCQLERVSVPPSNYMPQMGGKRYVMNVQTETKEKDEWSSL